MIGQDFLGQALVASQHQAARIAAGVGYPQEFKVGHDVLIIDRDPVEFLEEVEGDLRLPLFDRLPNHGQVIAQAQGLHLMSHVPERRDDVILRLPLDGREIHTFPGLLRRDQVFVHERQDAEFLHRATR